MIRRFRPRFSLRTLAIFVALACAYFASWGPTKRYASNQTNTVLSGNGTVLLSWPNKGQVVPPGTRVTPSWNDAIGKAYRNEWLVLYRDYTSPAPLILSRIEIRVRGPKVL